MELPGQNRPFLFSQMLQMFPNVPHDIIQMYTLKYANDADLCAQMLHLQNMKLMENRNFEYNLDSQLPEQLCDLKFNNDVALPTHVIEGNNIVNDWSSQTEPQPMLIDLHPKTACNSNDALNNTELKDLAGYFLDNYSENNIACVSNENVAQQNTTLNCQNLSDKCVMPGFISEDSSNLNAEKEIVKQQLYIPPLVQELLPNELHINIESDEECLHSWRPNLTINSLSSDFFLAQPVSGDTLETKNSVSAANEIESTEWNPMFINELECWNRLANVSEDISPGLCPENTNSIKIDIQSHLQFQKTMLNSVRYEVMKAKMELIESRDTVENMIYDLKKKLQSQDAQDIERLRNENAELRLECQCLCMEVDYYLKGKAPLGEIDEDFYEGNTPSEEVSGSINSGRNVKDNSVSLSKKEDPDNCSKWECPKCTFANHPAIKSCEMCHTYRIGKENSEFPLSTANTCYCHPKGKSVALPS